MSTAFRLLRVAAPYKWWMVLAVLLGSATVAGGTCLMATSAYLLSAAALHPSVADLAIPIVAVRFFGLVRGILRYLERYVSHSVNFRLLSQWRVWFYTALEPLAPARLMQLGSGDLLSRAVADVDALQDFYVRVLAPPAVAFLVILGLGAWMWSLSWVLAAALVAGWLLGGVALPILARALSQGPARRLTAWRAELHDLLVDGLQGLEDVLASGQEVRASSKVQEASLLYSAAQIRLASTAALSNGVGNLIAQLTLLLVLVLAISLVSAGHLDPVYLAPLALATIASFEAVLPLPQAAQSFERALEAARRLFALVDAEPQVVAPTQPVVLPPTLALEVRDLCFSYSLGDIPALDGLSFSVRPGQHLAIVGPSGAGKTTLVNLLMRFWEYGSGEILLGGIPLEHLDPSNIRHSIGVISQNPYLFNATLRDNLLLARPDATEAEIETALRRAQLGEFVRSLPRGLDTWVGERGVTLSAGERQRLAIARVLLRDISFLLLDEPTANLDLENERNLLRTVIELFAGRTILLITHRLVSLDAMDEILVLERGRLVERGNHAELVKRQGLYHRLWMLQNSPFLP